MKKRYGSLFDDVFDVFKKEYGDFDISLFDKEVKKALRLADKSLKFRIRTSPSKAIKGKTEEEIQIEIAKDMLYERAVYKSESFLYNYIHLDLSDSIFDVYQYKMRTQNFMNKYGDEKQKFGRTERTLKEWLERYAQGKIKKSTMNSILARFKKGTLYLKHKEGSK